MNEPVSLLCEGGVATLRFQRPAVLNALDAATARAFLSHCESLGADGTVRCIVLRGEGRAFMAGGDLGELRDGGVAAADALIEPLHAALRLLAAVDAPVVAALHGAVAGAGLSVALAADLAVATEGTRFNLAYANIGTSCDLGASWSLPRVVGLRRALEIALLGDTFDAQAALRMGLVNRVVPADALDAEVGALAARLAGGATLALGRIKRLMRSSFGRDLADQLDAEHQAFRASSATADFREGLAAFFDKRPARFAGR